MADPAPQPRTAEPTRMVGQVARRTDLLRKSAERRAAGFQDRAAAILGAITARKEPA